MAINLTYDEAMAIRDAWDRYNSQDRDEDSLHLFIADLKQVESDMQARVAKEVE